MKQLFLLLILCSTWASSVLAQEEAVAMTALEASNSIDIADDRAKYIYCELLGTSKFMSSKVNVEIDFGQAQNFFRSKDSRLRDKNGKVINFNSMVDALNYMGTIGWEFVQAYVVTMNNQNVYHWLLKKELDEKDMEEMKEMINKEK